jgi:trehalose/maltose hydrolase-like predicted phosphorylase
VVALLALLPERFAPDVQAANFAYYEPRCGHGSSLSRGLHAVVAARLGLVELAERYFRATAALDLEDRSGASNGGIRIAALGALWQTVVFGFSGVTLCPDGIALSPHLPASWQGLAYRLHWRGRVLHVRFDQRARSLTATLEQGAPMRLCVDGQQHTLQPQAALRLMFS